MAELERRLAGISAPEPAGEPAARTESAGASDLPPLEELVRRIPADVREVLDELFRARFTGVARAREAAAAQTSK